MSHGRKPIGMCGGAKSHKSVNRFVDGQSEKCVNHFEAHLFRPKATPHKYYKTPILLSDTDPLNYYLYCFAKITLVLS